MSVKPYHKQKLLRVRMPNTPRDDAWTINSPKVTFPSDPTQVLDCICYGKNRGGNFND